jgi:single-strand DNA-binding protein
MGSMNKVFLMGNITRDPEMKTLASGSTVTDFGLAVNRRYTTQAGEKKEEVCFVDITFWGKRAETIAQYLKKGSPVLVEGRLQLDQWTNDKGEKRSKLKVVGDNFSFISGGGEKKEEAEPGPSESALSTDGDNIPF